MVVVEIDTYKKERNPQSVHGTLVCSKIIIERQARNSLSSRVLLKTPKDQDKCTTIKTFRRHGRRWEKDGQRRRAVEEKKTESNNAKNQRERADLFKDRNHDEACLNQGKPFMPGNWRCDGLVLPAHLERQTGCTATSSCQCFRPLRHVPGRSTSIPGCDNQLPGTLCFPNVLDVVSMCSQTPRLSQNGISP